MDKKNLEFLEKNLFGILTITKSPLDDKDNSSQIMKVTGFTELFLSDMQVGINECLDDADLLFSRPEEVIHGAMRLCQDYIDSGLFPNLYYDNINAVESCDCAACFSEANPKLVSDFIQTMKDRLSDLRRKD